MLVDEYCKRYRVSSKFISNVEFNKIIKTKIRALAKIFNIENYEKIIDEGNIRYLGVETVGFEFYFFFSSK
jgi:hypothetical protein